MLKPAAGAAPIFLFWNVEKLTIPPLLFGKSLGRGGIVSLIRSDPNFEAYDIVQIA